jgi:hypothetical protein
MAMAAPSLEQLHSIYAAALSATSVVATGDASGLWMRQTI